MSSSRGVSPGPSSRTSVPMPHHASRVRLEGEMIDQYQLASGFAHLSTACGHRPGVLGLGDLTGDLPTRYAPSHDPTILCARAVVVASFTYELKGRGLPLMCTAFRSSPAHCSFPHC